MIFIEGGLFGFSVFGYEAILKSINKLIAKASEKIENIFEKKNPIMRNLLLDNNYLHYLRKWTIF